MSKFSICFPIKMLFSLFPTAIMMTRDCKNTPGIKISGIGSGTAIPGRVGSGIGPYLNSNEIASA